VKRFFFVSGVLSLAKPRSQYEHALSAEPNSAGANIKHVGASGKPSTASASAKQQDALTIGIPKTSTLDSFHAEFPTSKLDSVWDALLRRGSARLPALDGLRALSCLWVLSYHALGYWFCRGWSESRNEWVWKGAFSEWAASKPTAYVRLLESSQLSAPVTSGSLGVDAFLVISGFLIGRMLLASHQRRELAVGRERERMDSLAWSAAFLARRALRLLPMHALAVCLSLLWEGQREACGRHWLSHLLLTNNLRVGGMADGCVGQAWSVALEFQLYACSLPLVGWAARLPHTPAFPASSKSPLQPFKSPPAGHTQSLSLQLTSKDLEGRLDGQKDRRGLAGDLGRQKLGQEASGETQAVAQTQAQAESPILSAELQLRRASASVSEAGAETGATASPKAVSRAKAQAEKRCDSAELQLRRATFASCACIFGVLCCRALAPLVAPVNLDGAYVAPPDLILTQLPTRAGAYVMGVLCAFAHAHEEAAVAAGKEGAARRITAGTLGPAILSFVALLLVGIGPADAAGSIHQWNRKWPAAHAFVLVTSRPLFGGCVGYGLLHVLHRKSWLLNLLEAKIWIPIATVSYAAYMLQHAPLNIASQLATRFPTVLALRGVEGVPLAACAFVGYSSLLIATTLALAAAAHLAVERPALKWIRQVADATGREVSRADDESCAVVLAGRGRGSPK